MQTKYTLDALNYQKSRLEQLLQAAQYQDEITFYTQCLAEVNKDIENISKIDQNNAQNA